MGTASRRSPPAVHRPLEPAAFRGGLQDRPQTGQVAGVCFRSGIGTARILRGAIPEGMDTDPGASRCGGSIRRAGSRHPLRASRLFFPIFRQRHRSASGAHAGLLPRERRRGQAAETGLSAAIPAALQKLPCTACAGDAHGQRAEPDPAVPHAVGRGQGHRHGQSLVRGDDARRAGGAGAGPDGQQPHPLVADAAHDHPDQHFAHLGLFGQAHASSDRLLRFEDGGRHHAAHRRLRPHSVVPPGLVAEHGDGRRVVRHLRSRDGRLRPDDSRHLPAGQRSCWAARSMSAGSCSS